MCLVVGGMYACVARLGGEEWTKLDPGNAYYNLLVDGFRDGHLSLKKEVPSWLARMADPRDPVANQRYQNPTYGLVDLSYYKGRLYVYFGVTPAWVLYWPFVAMTGRYLCDRQATTILGSLGFLASVAVLCSMWRRYFAEVSGTVAGACALALGLATAVPSLLPRSEIHEVAILCAYMLTMLALGAIWRALNEGDPRKRRAWLAAASVAYGLAVGARPTLVFGGVIVLVPVAQGWRERRPVIGALAAALGPMAAIGVGLMVYNFLRFDNPLEFGQQYQWPGHPLWHGQAFSLRYLWFNLRVYFGERVSWSGAFPYLHRAPVPVRPEGYFDIQESFGVLLNVPLVWMGLAAPLAWRGRTDPARSVLRWFVVAVALQSGLCALTLGLYCTSAARYEADFLPALVLLAIVGVMGLERAVAPVADSAQTGKRVRRWMVRGGWVSLLVFSVVFNLLMTAEKWAHAASALGAMLVEQGHVPDGIRVLRMGVRIKPDYAEGQAKLGKALGRAGQDKEAIAAIERALQLNPAYAEGHYDLGCVLLQDGRTADAIQHLKESVRLGPSFLAYDALGDALYQTGGVAEATLQWRRSVWLNPDYFQAHEHLGRALMRLGRLPEAIAQYKEALRIDPDVVEARLDLGIALSGIGSNEEALVHLKRARRLRPDLPEVPCALGVALAGAGRVTEAVAQFREALRIKPDYPEAHFNLGQALEKLGRVPEAVEQYEQALRINPGFVQARDALSRLRPVR